MKPAQYVFDNAETNPEKVSKILHGLHKGGEGVNDILDFVQEAQKRMIVCQSPKEKTFDVCGTGGSGKSRINLSTALAIKLSKKFTIAKHGNKAASGKVGSFDLIERLGYVIGDTPEKVSIQLAEKNISFLFAPAFHPALKPLAPIRIALGHPTVFNYLGPILNPVKNLTAQMTGVARPEVGKKLAEVCAELGKNILLVYDKSFGLDDVSIGGQTQFWEVVAGNIKTGIFTPEDYGISRVRNFEEISGGNINKNAEIFEQLVLGTAKQAHQDFLKINEVIATEFFSKF